MLGRSCTSSKVATNGLDGQFIHATSSLNSTPSKLTTGRASEGKGRASTSILGVKNTTIITESAVIRRPTLRYVRPYVAAPAVGGNSRRTVWVRPLHNVNVSRITSEAGTRPSIHMATMNPNVTKNQPAIIDLTLPVTMMYPFWFNQERGLS